MSNLNLGNQTVGWRYKFPTKGAQYSKVLRGIVQPGVYEGGELSNGGSNVIIVNPFHAAINVDDDKLVTIHTSAAINLSASIANGGYGLGAITSATPYITMYYTWIEQINNFADFAFQAEPPTPSSNRILLGTAIFNDGGNVIGFEYDRTFTGLNENVIEYTANAEGISKGDFVEISNLDLTQNSLELSRQILNEKMSINAIPNHFSSKILNSTKALTFFEGFESDNGTATADYYMQQVNLDLENKNASYDVTEKFILPVNPMTYDRCLKLTEDKIVLVGSYNTSVKSIVIDISGGVSSAVVGSDQIFSNHALIDACEISDSKFLLISKTISPSNQHKYATVCTVSGSSVSYGTPLDLGELYIFENINNADSFAIQRIGETEKAILYTTNYNSGSPLNREGAYLSIIDASSSTPVHYSRTLMPDSATDLTDHFDFTIIDNQTVIVTYYNVSNSVRSIQILGINTVSNTIIKYTDPDSRLDLPFVIGIASINKLTANKFYIIYQQTIWTDLVCNIGNVETETISLDSNNINFYSFLPNPALNLNVNTYISDNVSAIFTGISGFFFEYSLDNSIADSFYLKKYEGDPKLSYSLIKNSAFTPNEIDSLTSSIVDYTHVNMGGELYSLLVMKPTEPLAISSKIEVTPTSLIGGKKENISMFGGNGENYSNLIYISKNMAVCLDPAGSSNKLKILNISDNYVFLSSDYTYPDPSYNIEFVANIPQVEDTFLVLVRNGSSFRISSAVIRNDSLEWLSTSSVLAIPDHINYDGFSQLIMAPRPSNISSLVESFYIVHNITSETVGDVTNSGLLFIDMCYEPSSGSISTGSILNPIWNVHRKSSIQFKQDVFYVEGDYFIVCNSVDVKLLKINREGLEPFEYYLVDQDTYLRTEYTIENPKTYACHIDNDKIFILKFDDNRKLFKALVSSVKDSKLNIECEYISSMDPSFWISDLNVNYDIKYITYAGDGKIILSVLAGVDTDRSLSATMIFYYNDKDNSIGIAREDIPAYSEGQVSLLSGGGVTNLSNLKSGELYYKVDNTLVAESDLSSFIPQDGIIRKRKLIGKALNKSTIKFIPTLIGE